MDQGGVQPPGPEEIDQQGGLGSPADSINRDERDPEPTDDVHSNNASSPVLDVTDHQSGASDSEETSASVLPALPDLRKNPSAEEVGRYLSCLKVHVQYFGENFILHDGWIDQFPTESKNYRSVVKAAEKICSNKGYLDQLAVCFELDAELSEVLEKLTTEAERLQNLTDGDVYTNSESGGRQSVVENTTHENAYEHHKDSDDIQARVNSLDIRVANLELSSDIEERLAQLENANARLNVNLFEERIDRTENQIKTINSITKVISARNTDHDERIGSLEKQMNVLLKNMSKDLNADSGINASQGYRRPGGVPQPGTKNLSNAMSQHHGFQSGSLTGNASSSAQANTQVHSGEMFQPRLVGNPNLMSLNLQSQNFHSQSASQDIMFQQNSAGNFNPNQKINQWQNVTNPHSQPMYQNLGDGFVQPGYNVAGTTNHPAGIHLPSSKPEHQPSGRKNSDNDDASVSSQDSVSDISNMDHLSNRGKRLKRNARSLQKMLFPKVDSNLTKVVVQTIHKDGLLRAVEEERKELERALEKYENTANFDTSLVDEVDNIIADAQEWSRGMREKYRTLDCSKKSLDKKLYDGLKKFGEDSDIHIFEFLKKFEAYTEEQGTAQERAVLLYEQYLQKDVQLELVDKAENYNLMRQFLINKFGDVKVITDNIIKVVAKENIPDDSSSHSVLTDYYRKLNSVMKKLQELSKTVDMPVAELEAQIYSSEFMTKLLKYVPRRSVSEFMEKMISSGQDLARIKGSAAFRLLSDCIHTHFSAHSAAARVDSANNLKSGDKTSQRRRTIHNVDVSPDDSEDEDINHAAHYQGTIKKPSKSSSKNKQTPKLISPCIVTNHSHEIGECAEFFTMSPVQRQKLGKKKICFTCMQPRDACSKQCSNLKKMPEKLICTKCKEWADKNERAPLNVLFCKKKDHDKPSNTEMVTALQEWLKGFTPGKIQAPIQLAAHVNLIGHSYVCSNCSKVKCSCKPRSKSSPVNSAESTPAINTSTGEKVELTEDLIVQEIDEDSIYVMQMLRLQDQDCLTFYDRGANQHLIDGEMAECIGAKVVSDKPTALGVVGGGQIWTEYGKYNVMLGPTPMGKYHQITAQGMSKVTEKFPLCKLREVNVELRKSGFLPKFKTKMLPKYIGGQKVNLLIGIKDPELEPRCLFQLPSGIGVYQSPFTDKFNSNICYGGPHSIFTSINKHCSGNINHISAFFTQMCNQYRNSVYPALTRALEPEFDELYEGVMVQKEISPKYREFTESGTSIYSTPMTSADFSELGTPVVDEMEDDLTDCICHITTSRAVDDSHEVPEHSVHKAKVPLSKLKEFLDEDDMGKTVEYRCSDCLQCKKCLNSDKVKMMSLQEKVEQEVIEQSVHVDLDEQVVKVDLPFIKPPVQYLIKKHGKDNNYHQALRVYNGMCRKSEDLKEGMRSVHADLVQKGFLKKLSDLPQAQKDIIENSGFKHYMPWRCVEKPDSLSTPVRLVVDPSMSGLNLILAKGTNNLTKINSILLRNRCRKHIWTSDVSKLYNHLVLKDSALPYGLFLYDESMCSDVKPEVYCMMVAWYGVTSSGNQSGEALEKLCKLQKDQYPKAYPIIQQDRYVDDILSGANSKEEVDDQVAQVKESIQHGNFPLKFVVRSGEKPCELASTDGETVRILGYKWNTEADILSPGFSEINFNKKSRGAKAPNPFPVVSPTDVSKLLDSTNISRRMIVSKLAEIFDPLGLWEPYKLQLKLEAQALNGLDWDVALEPEVQNHWKERFQQFTEIPKMTATRCIIPEDAVDPSKLRLICVSDAAVSAGGAAIYGSYLKADGTYSCTLLTAKSRRMKDSIPRNELEAIRLMAEMALDVKNSIGKGVEEVLFFTDSTIAMCWCHNLNKKLRLFVLNRVSQIRRLILQATGDQTEFPLFHIDGKQNIADLLTKPHSISPKDLGSESIWHNGLAWMKMPLHEMKVTRYADLAISKEDEEAVEIECFPLPSFTASKVHFTGKGDHLSHCQGCESIDTRIPLDKCFGVEEDHKHCDDCHCSKNHCFFLKRGRGSEPLIDIIKFGYLRTIRIMTNVISFTAALIHRSHIKRGIEKSDTCKKCKAAEETGGLEEEVSKIYAAEALNYFFRFESARLKDVVPRKKMETFVLKDGIYYYKGRLSEENPVTERDLDYNVFYDSSSIKAVLPVILSDSEFFFALVLHIHHRIRIHSGVEVTLKEVLSTVYVLNNPRRVIQSIRKNCPRCRIIAKRTLELEIAQHPKCRTEITPPFYNAMADTVFGFKGQTYKRSRKVTKIYALIIVCLLTSAVNILACEGLETQDIILALERHSSRHGVPSVIYVDKGTQLAALDNVEFDLRDLNAQLKDSMGMKIVTSTAKSHEERGRVERRVRTLREMLEKLSVKDDTCLTAMQWESLFAKISSQVNDLPMAKCSRSNFSDPTWDLLTPNRLMLGRNNSRSLEGSFNLLKGAGATEILRRNQNLQAYFYQMMLDRIHHFMDKPSKWTKTDEVKVGDICLFIYNENPGLNKDVWKLGRVVKVVNQRKIELTFPDNSAPDKSKMRVLTRSPRQICIISSVEDTDLNSRQFYDKIVSTITNN